MQKTDYILVGQGIAGTALAHTLIRKGHKVLVLDSQNPHTSSRVSAGFVNPITGKRMVKTWEADKLFSYLFDFYDELEQLLDVHFFHRIPMIRTFHSTEQQNSWFSESAEKEKTKYISRTILPNKVTHINAPFGGVEIKKTGYINVPLLLNSFRDYLRSKEAFIETTFDENELIFENNRVIWKDYEAKKVIFCRGFEDSKSKFFDWLPFRATKGEILDLELEVDLQQIINKGCWVIPTQNKIHRVGSTYDLENLDHFPTEEAKLNILERFEKLTSLKYKVVGHKAGVRPTTIDRHLFVGLHPENKQVAIFNGLGTKGISQAPYFAQSLCDFLEHETPIMPAVDIQRYDKLYPKS